MEKQYLTYQQYREMGGTLDEAPFKLLELEARKNIDRRTFGRLINLDEQITEVKYCMFDLIEMLYSYKDYSKTSKGVSGESIDGYSVSYGSTTESITKAKMNDIKGIIEVYLSECKTEKGVPYLYIGADK